MSFIFLNLLKNIYSLSLTNDKNYNLVLKCRNTKKITFILSIKMKLQINVKYLIFLSDLICFR